MIYLVTSGFSYDDWVGNFYPIGRPKREWITYYAREFNTCEVNSTYYSLLQLSGVKAMVEKTSENFLLSTQVHQEMTHQRVNNAAVFEAFCPMLEPVISVVFANNHWRGQAVSTIRQLRVMLD